MIVCFIGHRKIVLSDTLKDKVYKTVIALIKDGADTFLFGSRSEFDALCLDVVSDIKKQYPHIKRIYVRSEYQHINKSYEAYLLESYEETYFPTRIQAAGRYSYVERNQEIINRSDSCVFYYNKDYVPPPKRQNFHMPLSNRQVNSGTKLAFEYAVSKSKHIINLYNL